MGLKKNWDVADIANQLHSLSRECCSSYNDGFTAFEFKKELYQLKFIIDEALNKSPNFGSIEKDWLEEQEKKKIVKILKS